MNVVLVDDHPLVLAGLQQLLRSSGDFDVRAACRSVEEGWAALTQHRPDVLVLDLMLGNDTGLNLLRRLDPDTPPAVVVLTAVEEEDVWLDAARLGASALVLKATAPRVLEDCIRAVHGGHKCLNVSGVDLARRVAERRAVEAELDAKLTPREVAVVRQVAAGLDNQEIAEHLMIGVGTVKIHLHHAYRKLHLGGRRDLLRFLRERNY